ncbi:hypothetical protein RRG08_037102 [Elysia crispata]|uniref:Uncharacterized protein n=1 Tax=Elysia crispata TaxID=231223 RepID=A0AAE0Y4Z4_9GAST|nr:hypothetical protein RRG08_037102 [Elysia crispata]
MKVSGTGNYTGPVQENEGLRYWEKMKVSGTGNYTGPVQENEGLRYKKMKVSGTGNYTGPVQENEGLSPVPIHRELVYPRPPRDQGSAWRPELRSTAPGAGVKPFAKLGWSRPLCALIPGRKDTCMFLLFCLSQRISGDIFPPVIVYSVV